MFENRTNNPEITKAILKAEKLFRPDSTMMFDICKKNDFKYNSGTGEEVFQRIVNYKETVPVFTYRSRNPFTRALGYSDRYGIHINTRKLQGMSIQTLVGLLCHEYLHQVGFSHGNNFKTQDKVLYSVPYFVSENIGRWL